MADLLAKLLLTFLLLLQARHLLIADARSLITAPLGGENDPTTGVQVSVATTPIIIADKLDANKEAFRMLGTFNIDYEDPQPNVSHNPKGKGPSINGSTTP